MSDPVKNTEVEDVLSSIRRLVSEDKRPKPDAKPVAPNDRLVLTPALRVEKAVDPEREAREDVVDEVPEDPSVAPEDDYSMDPYKFDDAADLDEESDASEAIAEDADTKALSAKIAALETAIGDITDEWEPDSAGVNEYAGSEAPAMDWEDVTEEATADSSSERHTEAWAAETAKRDAVLPETTEEAEASEPETGDAAGPQMSEKDAEHAAEAEGLDASHEAAGPEEPPQEQGFAAFGGDDHLLDEDVLREMITEIVQSELRGEMGERITRNVRRLVRREIHRALTARDLE